MKRWMLSLLTCLTVCGSMLSLACSSNSDPTFASVCPAPDNVHFVYPVGDSAVSTVCSDPTPIAWNKTQLTVQMASDVSDDYSSSVTEAVNFWNSNVDLTLFKIIPGSGSSNADVDVVIGSASDNGDGATIHDVANGVMHATVEIRQPGDLQQVYLIVAHELGHVLGLAHDYDTYASVMYPKLEYLWDSPDSEASPFRVIVVTDNDRDALRERYGA